MNEGHFLILQDLIITLEKTVKNIQNTVVLNARTKLEKDSKYSESNRRYCTTARTNNQNFNSITCTN